MTTFVIGDRMLLLVGQHLGSFLQTTDDTIDSIQEILFINLFLILSRRDKCSFITDIGDIGTRETRRLFSQKGTINKLLIGLIFVNLEVLHVDRKDSLAFLKVRQFNVNLTVETASTQQPTLKKAAKSDSVKSSVAN